MDKIKKRVASWFMGVPKEYENQFLWDCAQKNNFRFSILPIFNIVTQISCYFIYLYVYPATFPDMPTLDPLGFTAFSAFYIAANILFFFMFNRLRRRNNPQDLTFSHRLLIVFLLMYVALESIETIMEVEISGNIYRFLATFFMVAFLPVIRRREKFALITFFAILVELGFAYITAFQGYSSNNRFQDIVILFYLVCVVVANISYTSTIKTFSLKQEVLQANKNLREANEKLEQLAVIDPLTQVSNRRAFDQYMSLAWRSGFSEQKPVNVIMIDVDDFKAFNDTYGHQMGDDCLKKVAHTIGSFFQRESDMVARFGGEEFVVLTTHGSLEETVQIAEKVREAVEALAIPNKNSRASEYVTISVGVASMIPSKENRFENLVKNADDALYRAKDSGRNCFRVYEN